MSYRFTNTDKWNDAWFSNLEPTQKLLFNYLCDNCDIAGIIELNIKRWGVDIGFSMVEIKAALKGLGRGLIYSKTNDCIYLKNFLKHQKNLPLNEKNQAHKGIMKRLELYKMKFGFNQITDFYEAPSEGLTSPTGNGNGNGNGILGGAGGDFIEEIIQVFQQCYFEANQIEYVIINKEIERSCTGKLLGLYKKKNTEANSEQTLEGFRVYFNAVMKIKDDWIQKNMSIPTILRDHNKINKIYRDGNKQSKSQPATSDRELTEIMLKHWGDK